MRNYFVTKDYPSSLNIPIQRIEGIGKKRSIQLKRLGVNVLGDMLFYFPRKYEDRRKISKISEVCENENQIIKGRILGKETIKRGKHRITRLKISDGTEPIYGIWFNQPYIANILEVGKEITVLGRVQHRFNTLQILVKEFTVKDTDPLFAGRIMPIYPSTSGLPQKLLRRMSLQAVMSYKNQIKDKLPKILREKYSLISMGEALRHIHFPPTFHDLSLARQRLSFEELFMFYYCLSEMGKNKHNTGEGIAHTEPNTLKRQLANSLGFDLTSCQNKAIKEIENDMEKSAPMRRLLQGDVGSGKTLVAVFAILKAVSNNYQCAFMVPTEVLAEQHYLNLSKILPPLGIKLEILTGSTPMKKRTEILTCTEEGKVDVLVGTHALIQEDVVFSRLGLAVIDEQHRFGVRQRTDLGSIHPSPDVLVMTATPIPRSLALTLYGDLKISMIETMPPGRQNISTFYVPENKREGMYDFIRELIKEGRQAYFVCPLIEESESLNVIALNEMAVLLKERYFNEFTVEILHGRLNKEEKNDIMNDFRDGKIDVLAATTVIEVGIDVPNAAVIVIEGVERYGLAQLHQLRGRVGRGRHKSYCFLLGNPRTPESKKRIETMIKFNDGFNIAEADFHIRGPGELMGTQQHGMPRFKIADLEGDKGLIKSIIDECGNLPFTTSPEEREVLLSLYRDIVTDHDVN